MRNLSTMKRLWTSLSFALSIIVCLQTGNGCSAPDMETARQRLEVILQDDLVTLNNEIPLESRRDSSYYVIVEYATDTTGGRAARAEVVFYVLRNDPATVVRKYYYHPRYGQWERYYNKYHYSADDNPQLDTSATR